MSERRIIMVERLLAAIEVKNVISGVMLGTSTLAMALIAYATF